MPGSAAARLARLADGYLVTQLLHLAVTLGVPDALAARAGAAAELGAEPGPLHRVLRGLAAEEVLDELRAEVPGSLRGAVTARAQLYSGAVAPAVARP